MEKMTRENIESIESGMYTTSFMYDDGKQKQCEVDLIKEENMYGGENWAVCLPDDLPEVTEVLKENILDFYEGNQTEIDGLKKAFESGEMIILKNERDGIKTYMLVLSRWLNS